MSEPYTIESLYTSLLSEKERALHLAGHPAIERCIKGEITFPELQKQTILLVGSKRYLSRQHELKLQQYSGQVLTVKQLKSLFTAQQLAYLKFA